MRLEVFLQSAAIKIKVFHEKLTQSPFFNGFSFITVTVGYLIFCSLFYLVLFLILALFTTLVRLLGIRPDPGPVDPRPGRKPEQLLQLEAYPEDPDLASNEAISESAPSSADHNNQKAKDFSTESLTDEDEDRLVTATNTSTYAALKLLLLANTQHIPNTCEQNALDKQCRGTKRPKNGKTLTKLTKN